MSEAVEIVELPARVMVAVRGCVRPDQMREAQHVARQALAGAGLSGSRRLTLWRPDVDGRFDYAPGEDAPAGFAAAAPLSVIELPPGRAAHVAFRGGYEGLGEAWSQLFAQAQALGLRSGWNLEVYAADGAPPGADLYAMIA